MSERTTEVLIGMLIGALIGLVVGSAIVTVWNGREIRDLQRRVGQLESREGR